MKNFYSGEIYHVFNKSIANFGIFKDKSNCQRFIETLDYYNSSLVKERFSWAVEHGKYHFKGLFAKKENLLFKIISYCIMPDHYHIMIKILKDKIFSKFINDLENSYTRYFNIKFKRKGPLWQSSFKSVRIKTDEQLLHVSRYHHLNPVTSFFVDKPEDWEYSSYNEYLTNPDLLGGDLTEISITEPSIYKSFVENRIDYQRRLRIIKKQILE